MPKQVRDRLASLRAGLLNHPIYAEVASVDDLRRYMKDRVFAGWNFMSLLKRLQQDLTLQECPGSRWIMPGLRSTTSGLARRQERRPAKFPNLAVIASARKLRTSVSTMAGLSDSFATT